MVYGAPPPRHTPRQTGHLVQFDAIWCISDIRGSTPIGDVCPISGIPPQFGHSGLFGHGRSSAVRAARGVRISDASADRVTIHRLCTGVDKLGITWGHTPDLDDRPHADKSDIRCNRCIGDITDNAARCPINGCSRAIGHGGVITLGALCLPVRGRIWATDFRTFITKSLSNRGRIRGHMRWT